MSGKIKIANILKFIILYSLVVNFMAFTFGTPTSLLYVNDVLLLIIAFSCCQYFDKEVSLKVPKPLAVIFALLILFAVVGYSLNLYSPWFVLWGARNNFRTFVYFFACCICLKKKDVYDICGVLYKLFPLNVVLCTVQYIQAINSPDPEVQKFIGDHVGGIFGSETSCNRMLNIYVLFIFTWALTLYLQKKMRAKRFAVLLLCCAYVSVLAELKIVIFEVVLILAVLFWLMEKKVSRLGGFVLGMTVLYGLINIWGAFDANVGTMLNSLESILDYTSASSYGRGSVNRLTVIPVLHELFFEGEPLKILFGLGLGNADTSGYSFLITPLYQQYKHLKYNYFMHGLLYLETGAVGLVLYCSFFVFNFFNCMKIISRKRMKDAIVYVGAVFNVIAVLCIFYNTTLRSELSSYMTFFFLAIPIIWNNADVREKQTNLDRVV